MTNRRDAEGRPEGEGPKNRQGAAYQGALEAVFAILIAAFLGKLADDYFGTSPYGLLIGFVIGFASFVLRLVQLGRISQRTKEDEEPVDRRDEQ
jgi:ATP synthase protein I